MISKQLLEKSLQFGWNPDLGLRLCTAAENLQCACQGTTKNIVPSLLHFCSKTSTVCTAQATAWAQYNWLVHAAETCYFLDSVAQKKHGSGHTIS